MVHYCHFNKNILNPIKRSGSIGEGKKAYMKLQQQILDEILLRRTKTSRADDIKLPPRIVRVRQEKLDANEEDYYEALYTQSQAQFNTYVQSGTVLNNYAHIFDILIRLRQAVDHPYLVIHSNSNKELAPLITNEKKRKAAVDECDTVPDCGLCRDPVEEPCRNSCGHIFCKPCILEYVETSLSRSIQNNDDDNDDDGEGKPKAKAKKSNKLGSTCPTCSATLNINFDEDIDDFNDFDVPEPGKQTSSSSSSSVWDTLARRRKSILNKLDLSKFKSSTKMEALMEELYKMQQSDLGAKALVFSQFCNMLDLLEFRIERGGIKTGKLQGHMNITQRDAIIKDFKENPECKVLLISLKAGGVALNLTVASHVRLSKYNYHHHLILINTRSS